MAQAREIIIRDGKVVIVKADGNGWTHPSFSPDWVGEICEYLTTGKQVAFSINKKQVTFSKQDLIDVPSPKVAEREEKEAEEKRIKDRQKAEQEAARALELANLQAPPENGRIDFALQQIRSMDALVNRKAYSDAAKEAWTLVRRHTAGPAISFFDAQKEARNATALIYRALFQHLEDWLKSDLCLLASKPTHLLNFDKLSSDAYRALTIELLGYLSWLGRLAEGESKLN